LFLLHLATGRDSGEGCHWQAIEQLLSLTEEVLFFQELVNYRSNNVVGSHVVSARRWHSRGPIFFMQGLDNAEVKKLFNDEPGRGHALYDTDNALYSQTKQSINSSIKQGAAPWTE
tara:strand:- start:4717 stop:5064 length:348 start_codon:yes stop_codon:yes gene_type:complete